MAQVIPPLDREEMVVVANPVDDVVYVSSSMDDNALIGWQAEFGVDGFKKFISGLNISRRQLEAMTFFLAQDSDKSGADDLFAWTLEQAQRKNFALMTMIPPLDTATIIANHLATKHLFTRKATK
jgi:hypothetical protein